MKPLFSILGLTWLLIGLGCSEVTGPDPEDFPEPEPDRPEVRQPDAVLGQAAFVESCASCHASHDGYDLALFGFPEADIVRRAVAHVDTLTALDIAAYIQTLNVEPVSRNKRPFQPGEAVLDTEQEFWTGVFGTPTWSDDLTPEAIRTLDPRSIPVSLGLPFWSNESDDSDWMPDHPLPSEVLDAQGGEVRSAINAYHMQPTLDNLLTVIERFRSVTMGSESSSYVCAGEVATHTQPETCFESRRWVSSLAAMHLLRNNITTDVPFEIAQIWWETGEAAVSRWVNARNDTVSRANAARWMYLGFIYAPEGFPERSSYLGQHLIFFQKNHLATFAALRRMVGDGRAHEVPNQHVWDAVLASTRAPQNLKVDITEFCLRYLLDRARAGLLPEDKADARGMLDFLWTAHQNSGVLTEGTPETDSLTALRDELLSYYE